MGLFEGNKENIPGRKPESEIIRKQYGELADDYEKSVWISRNSTFLSGGYSDNIDPETIKKFEYTRDGQVGIYVNESIDKIGQMKDADKIKIFQVIDENAIDTD